MERNDNDIIVVGIMIQINRMVNSGRIDNFSFPYPVFARIAQL